MRYARSSTTLVRVIVVAACTALAGCGESERDKAQLEAAQVQIKALKTQITELETQLDEFRNGADRLLGATRHAAENGHNAMVVEKANELATKHPGSPQAQEAAALSTKAKALMKEAEEAHQREMAKQAADEERRLAKIQREREATLASAVGSMTKRVDSIRELTVYRHKSAPAHINTRSILEPYLVVSSSGIVTLRLRNVYVADTWLFIEHYTIKADDRIFEIPGGISSVKRDNAAGEIWEWTDEQTEWEDERMLEAIGNAKVAVIRYQGQHYRRDRTIPASEKKMIREVLTARDALRS